MSRIPSRPRFSRRLAACAALFAAALSAAAAPAYLFTSFRGTGDGLHLASSPDALRWTDLGKVFLRPTVGEKLFRDPHLTRDASGLWRLVWTTGWKDLGIGYATSTDLVTWSPQRHLPVAARIPGAKNAWAPEIFPDPERDRYVITWNSDVEGWFAEEGGGGSRANNRTYYVTTRDFVTFTEPSLLIEPGFDHIDTTIIPWLGRYIAVFRQGDDRPANKWGQHHAAIADSPTGPYRMLPGTLPPAAGVHSEGATVFPMDDRCLLYAPITGQDRCAVFVTRDWAKWEELGAGAAAPVKGQNQGNIVTVTSDELAVLTGQVPVPSPARAVSGVPAPILPGRNADPAIRVFGDTYYLYPTTDVGNWGSTAFAVWTSRDLVNWSSGGTILDLPRSLGWAKRQAWTPDCIERDGNYFLYFCAEAKIGVATASQPTGPFIDARGAPLLQAGGQVRAQTISPHAFIDDDGQAYLYYGSGRGLAQVVRLAPDMVNVVGSPVDLPINEFVESLVVFKRRNLYYFMWTAQGRNNQPTRVCYGVSESPTGPIRRPAGDEVVLRSAAPLAGVGYHSVLNIPGTDRWYMAYHRHAIPGGGLDKREVCLARLEFGPDGSLLPVDALAPAFAPGSAGEPLTQGRGRP